MILSMIFAPIVLFLIFRSCHLVANYIAANKYGLPIIVCPVSFEDPWWIVIRPLFSWVERLPFGLGNWYIYTTMGWPQEDNIRTVKRLGENFVLCSPNSNIIVTCYPPAMERCYGEIKNWVRLEAQSRFLAFYGENVSSKDGAEWQRHRKITSSAFNENTMHEVWKETATQVNKIDFDKESVRTLGRIRTTFDIVAMGVLASVGFGQDIDLISVPPNHRESFMDSLGFILQNIMITGIFHGLKAPDFLLPEKLRRLKVSVAEFRLHMQESVLRHIQSAKKSNQSKTTSLLESMVKANEAEKNQLQHSTGRPSYLTESELYGNMFVFNAAGFETTAGTMTFALPFLAAHSEYQDWVTEEVDKYHDPESIDSNYAATYPKLVRTLAVMYETLRLTNPAPMLVRRSTKQTELPIITPSGPSTLNVAPGTIVGGEFYGAHLSPLWGPEAEIFNPKRFVSVNESGEEKLVVPEGPIYCPWVFGPRVCPGKKFSQVEFVALVAQILSKYRVEAFRNEGESVKAAESRLMGVLDHKFFNISTHLKHPEDASIQLVRRQQH
ncbi:cytochrome P450 [Corynespora cassiicola Philippines]|uniref:Cytochrome P450 n=1 Tax=Corynespora cassiicola Philippines TaxID=1448308 RepID=A0A2T2NM83_CORCC|nr:cytochrome P450 [Corynespora cassiicola Philippines]